MTATPIPRTVSLTLFGDLDVSTLRDSPPGRQTVHTYLAQPEQRAQWWEFFRKKLREGRQGYVIAPLVEESDRVAAANLPETFEALANGELAEFRLGLLHGRMTPAEKDAAMQAFRDGQTQVLVCHERGRGRRRCAQRHADDDRRGRAVRPVAAPPVARPHQPRHASGLLLRLRRPASDETPPAAGRVRRARRTASSWPRSTSSSAAPATCSARGSTACRRCASPTWLATRELLDEARRDAQAAPGTRPRPGASPSTLDCTAWCCAATARRWIWEMWGKANDKPLQPTVNNRRRKRRRRRSGRRHRSC